MPIFSLVWSPGSTTTSSSTETTIPATAHQISSPPPVSTPDGFRPPLVSASSTSIKTVRSTERAPTSLSPTTSEVTPNDHQLQNIGEIYDPNQTITPVHKYWTLPRNIATATKTQYLIEDEQVVHQPPSHSHMHHHHHHQHNHPPQTPSSERHIHRQVVTDLSPPPNAKYIEETDDTKYFIVPESGEVTTTRKVVSAPPKSDGIGPVDENGIPLALKSVRL